MSDSESYEDYIDARFPRWLSLVLLFTGLFGNLISFIVFNKMNIKKNSTFVYLSILCIVDLFVLIFGLGDIILLSYFTIVIRNHSLIVCRVHTFLTYVSTHLSSFILASVSIDRAIATNAINFAKFYCKPTTAYKIILLNLLITFVINFHNLIFLGYETTDTQSFSNLTMLNSSLLNYVNASSVIITSTKFICGSEQGSLYDQFLEPYFQLLDLLVYAIFPFIIMAICTFLIIRIIFKSNKRLNRSKLLKNKNTLIKAVVVDEGETNVANLKQAKTSLTVSTRKVSRRKNKSRKNKTMHLTYTLITINALFFCLVSPLAIVIILIRGKQSVEKYTVLINVVYLLAYSNHSFNFIFYGLSSPPYRDSFLQLFRLRKEKKRTVTNLLISRYSD